MPCHVWLADNTFLSFISGYDGTARVWSATSNLHMFLEHTLIFRKFEHAYGNELNGDLIGLLSWSPSGKFLAAAVENIVNIWHVPGKLEFVYAYTIKNIS